MKNLFINGIAITGIVVLGNYLFQYIYRDPDCWVSRTEQQQEIRERMDTLTGPAHFKIKSITTTDIQRGERPRPVQDGLDWIIDYAMRKLDKVPTESFHYVLQAVILENVALDTATFVFEGWVTLASNAKVPVYGPAQRLVIPPGHTGKATYNIELPKGSDMILLDQMTAESILIRASTARNAQKVRDTVVTFVTRTCNTCLEKCD